MGTMAVSLGDMSSEFKRYATFSDFQSPAGIWPLQLAKEGFYRSSICRESEVVCFSCGLVLDLKTINRGSLMEIHKQRSPSCSFLVGSSDNQPVPPVNSGVALEWLSQNFSFDLIQDTASDANHSHNSLPNMQASRNLGSPSDLPHSLPVLPDSFSLVPLLPHLSDLSTLEQPGLDSQQPNWDPPNSLLSDLLHGFANTTLDSIPSAALFQEQHFGSSLGGPAEILVTDGEPQEEEGHYPAPCMPLAEISNYTGMTQQPETEGSLQSENNLAPKITFDDLGIIIQRPKRQEYATLQQRLDTFNAWRGPVISQSWEQIAEAGFYYAGYSDCCRCFYCGGGLKSWEEHDDPWVEHAHWFQTCPFVLTNKGKDFVEAVQSLARTNATITKCDVEAELNHIKSMNLKNLNDVIGSDDLVMDTQNAENGNIQSEAERLSDENQSLRQPELCKICLDAEVCVLYVPCGHLVTCGTCAPTMKSCPVCRSTIQGQVRIQRTD